MRPNSLTLPIALTACPLLLTACVEHEEIIEIHPDASVTVTMKAEGAVSDLAEGYSLGLQGPWKALNSDTAEWLQLLGPDLGGAATQARLAEARQRGEVTKKDGSKLAVEARFKSVRDLPSNFVPASEPYPDEYLTRSADLSIEQRGGKTVYVFERTYHGLGQDSRWDFDRRMKEELDDDVIEELSNGADDLSEKQMLEVAGLISEMFVEAGDTLSRAALASIYLEGDANLDTDAVTEIAQRCQAAVETIVPAEALVRVWYELLRTKDDDKDDDGPNPFEVLEREVRNTLRVTLDAGLAGAGVRAPVRNGVLARLEGAFVRADHISDLKDEVFKVKVRMPGTIVSGNFHELDDGAAEWEVAGNDLRMHDATLRIVSVAD